MARRRWSLVVPAALVLASCSSGPRTLDGVEGPLVYVAIGTSTVVAPGAGEGAIHVYRDLLAADLDVEVELRDHTAPGLPATELLRWFETNDRLLDDLAVADVVTLHIPKSDWIVPYAASARGTVDCGGDDGQQCWRDALATYEQRAEAVLSALTDVVDPHRTLVRIQDEHMPFFAGSDADRMIAWYWRMGEAHVEEVAAAHGIPVAQVFDAFHGPDGVGVPCDEGLLQEDCDHATAAGARLMAELLHDLGHALAS